MIDHLGLIHFSYVWLCNWKNPFLAWPKGKSLRTLRVGQTLPWSAPPTQCSTMRFLCALVVQLVDQPCTTFNSTICSEIHHQRPQLVGFSNIRWSKLLLISYKATKTSLVSCEHNRKTKRCLAHLYLLPMSYELHHSYCWGWRRYHVIWLKMFLIHLNIHQLLEKQLQPSTNLRNWTSQTCPFFVWVLLQHLNNMFNVQCWYNHWYDVKVTL
jgi:hypothetical protein